MSLYVVTGTDTGVGKTFVSVALLRGLRDRGLDAIGLKPVETGWDEPASDAAALAGVSGREIAETIWGHFELPAAPAVAARAEGREIEVAEVTGWIRGWSGEWTLVEGAGGWLVPFAEDALFRDLAVGLRPDGVLLVASDRLGTINHTLLSVESIRAAGCRLVGVAISARSECPETVAEIRARVTEPVWVIPDELDAMVEMFHVEHRDRHGR
jgi:dethiobiotin synthase